MNASTTAVTITSGEYAAEIALRGGQLLSLTSQGQDLIVPATQAEGAFPGAVLAPWPNRIANAAYTHDETPYSLPVNEPESGGALHGLLYDVDFTIQLHREDTLHLIGVLEPSEGYPFRLEVVLVYRVGMDLGLSTSIMTRYAPEGYAPEPSEESSADRTVPESAETIGDAAHRTPDQDNGTQDTLNGNSIGPTPFGAGFHPYLTAGGAPLRECRLRLPAGTVADCAADGEVIGRSPACDDLDLTGGPLLAGRTLDHAFTDLPEEGWTAELLHGPTGLMVRMIADTPWVQVYTGERIDRIGVSVGPMTCPPNAFNSGEDVVFLSPGEWFRVGFSLEAFRL